jgi:hypothetical protein
MKLLSVSIVLIALTTTAYSQISTRICDIVANPSVFHGELVRIRAMRVVGFEISAIRDPDVTCSAVIWLDYAPELLNRTRKQHESGNKNDDFESFEGMNAGSNGSVAAIMTGRIEYAAKGFRFGHLNQYPIRFELQSVADPFIAAGFLAGQVNGPDGHAVANAEVSAKVVAEYPSSLYASESLFGFTSCTDERGHFTLTVPPGKYLVGVNLEDAAIPAVPFLPVYAPGGDMLIKHQERKELSLTLGEARHVREIEVEVAWPNGSPAKNVEVAVGNLAFDELYPEQGKTNDAGTLKLRAFDDVAQFAYAQIRTKDKLYFAKVTIPTSEKLKGNLMMKLAKDHHRIGSTHNLMYLGSGLRHPCWYHEKRD